MMMPIRMMAPNAASIATPRSDARVRFMSSLIPWCSVAVAQADLDAHRIAQRDRGLAGEIDVGLALPTDDDADSRDQVLCRRDRAGGIVVGELQTARRAGPRIRAERAGDRLRRRRAGGHSQGQAVVVREIPFA